MDWCHIRPKNFSYGLEITMRGSITKFLVVLCILFYPGKVSGIGIITGIDVLSVRADVEMLQDELHVRVEDSRPLQSPGRHLHHIRSVLSSNHCNILIRSLYSLQLIQQREWWKCWIFETFNKDQSPSPSPDSIYLVLLFVDTPGLSYF